MISTLEAARPPQSVVTEGENHTVAFCSAELLPPTHPATAVAPCPAAPAGFPPLPPTVICHSHHHFKILIALIFLAEFVVVLYWVFSWLCCRDHFLQTTPPLLPEDSCSCLSWRDPVECHLSIFHLGEVGVLWATHRAGNWLQPCLIWLISYCGGKKAQSLVSLQLKFLLAFTCTNSMPSGLCTPTRHPWVQEHVWQVPPVIYSPHFANGKLIIGLKLCKNVKGKKSQDHRKNSNVFPSLSLPFASTDRSSKYLGEKCVWAFQHLANINYLRAGSDKQMWGMLRSVEIATFKFCSSFQYFSEWPSQD